MSAGWIGPLSPPASASRAATALGAVAGRLCRGRGWIWAALLAGAAPLLLEAPFGGSLHQHVSSMLLFILIVGAAHSGRFAQGVGVIALGFGGHCVVAVALSRYFPDATAGLFPGGPDYWAQTHTWLVTGKDPEYELAAWVPAHLQLAGAMVLLGYLSMGIIPFLQGFHEVDLMNFYVGRLLAVSADAPMSLVLGWHPWSVSRGLGFCLLVMTLGWLSYCRFTGRPPGPWRAHALRFGLGVLLLGLDGLLKYELLEVVRVALASRLVEGAG